MVIKTGTITIDNDENVLHPVTDASAVYTGSGSTVEDELGLKLGYTNAVESGSADPKYAYSGGSTATADVAISAEGEITASVKDGSIGLQQISEEAQGRFSRKFVFASGTLEQVLISAYENEDFVNAVGFAETTDVGSDGKPVYGEVIILTEELTKDSGGQTIGAEYSVVANGELYHAVLLENGGNYTVAISNPYVKKDDAVLAKALESISGVQQGIVGQYLKQTPAVLVGSDYAINLKLRESRNLVQLKDIPETTTGGVTYSITDGVVKAEGAVTSRVIVNKIVTFDPLPAGTYTFSARLKNASNFTGNNYITFSLSMNGNYVTNCSTGVAGGGKVYSETCTASKPFNELNMAFIANNTFDQEISDIQIEKGSTAHPYDEYGTYSKGSVVQYAGKNVLNLPGTSAMGETAPFLYASGETTITTPWGGYYLNFKTDGTLGDAGDKQKALMRKNHNYALLMRTTGNWNDMAIKQPGSGPITYMFSGDDGVVASTAYPTFVASADGKTLAIAKMKATIDTDGSTGIGVIISKALINDGNGFTVDAVAIIDLTSAGDDSLTSQEVLDKYSASLATLASGASIANGKRTSPLIKNFGTGLYLTKPEGYSLIISEFSDMPPALNQSVDFDGLTFLAQTKYSSSGKVTLQPATQSIIYMVEKDDGTTISDGDLALWQPESQLEYGDYATDITAYIAPKVLGAFDYLEGDAKSIITEVGEGDNVHVGFIPDEGYLGIDYANSTDDLSQSYVAYRTIDLATQVANNTDEIEGIKSDLGVKDGEVTSEKIADGAVTEEKIADGAVALSKLGSDAKEYIDTKVSFLKLDDDGVLPQTRIPRFGSVGEIAKDSATLKGKFGTGNYNLINGLVLDCFLVIGTTLCVGKFNGDAENEIYIDNITPLENGAIVSMSDGNAHYKNYQVLENTTTAWGTNIWEMIYPMNCRFEYYVGGGVLICRKMENADITFTPDASPTRLDCSLEMRNCRSMSVYCATKDTNRTIQYNGYGINSNMLPAQVSMAKKGYSRPLPASDCVTNTVFKCHLGNVSASNDVAFPLLSYDNWHLFLYDSPKTDSSKCYQYISNIKAYGEDADTNRLVTGTDGSKGIMQFCPVFDVSSIGLVRLDGYAYYEPYTEPAAPTMAKARAMSVEPMSLQTEPAKPNVPDDAIGIFSVDEQGNTIDAMTGERI